MRGRKLVAAALAWPALAMSGGACEERSARPPPPRAPSAADAGQARPHIDLDSTAHDFGTVVQSDELRHTFEILNPGPRAVLLYSEPGQRCAAPVYPPEVPAGGRVPFEVICRLGSPGDLLDTVIVRGSYDKHGVVAEQTGLKLTAHVAPAAAFEPELVTVRVPFGQPSQQEARVTGTRAAHVRLGAPRIELLDPAPVKPLFTVEKLPAGAGKPAGIALRVAGRAVGAQNGRIIVPTGLANPPEPREIALAFFVGVTGTLKLEPPDALFIPGTPEGRQRVIEVSSAQPGFAVRAVKVVRGPFDAALEPGAAAGATRVKVTLRDAHAKPDHAGVLGIIKIISNDRAEPGRELPLRLYGFHGDHAGHGEERP